MQKRKFRFDSWATFAFALTFIGVVSCNSDNGTPAPPPQPGATPAASATPVPSATPTVTPSATPENALKTGEYGGKDIKLSVTANAVNLRFACAQGNIDHFIHTDAAGAFDTTGTFTLDNGPVPVGGYPVFKARYSGVVDGDTVHLNIAYRNQNDIEVDESFDATYGQPAVITVVCAL